MTSFIGHQNLRSLQIKPNRETFSDPALKLEFDTVNQLFQYFVGRDKIRNFVVHEVVLLDNPTLEAAFIKKYMALQAKPPSRPWEREGEPDLAWKRWILDCFSRYARNISGEENSNLVLGWHGGASEKSAASIAETNFEIRGVSHAPP